MPATLDAVEAVLRQQAEGRATNRARRRVALPKSGLNVMFAGAPDLDALGLKAYTVARGGARFYTMLFDPETESCSRSSNLTRSVDAHGCGERGRHQTPRPRGREHFRHLRRGLAGREPARSIAAVRNLDRVIVYSRREESRKEFAAKMGERLGREIETTHATEEPAAQDIVVTVTSLGSRSCSASG
jgi:ornithine cyclodeaminase/alanine dehydrogenase